MNEDILKEVEEKIKRLHRWQQRAWEHIPPMDCVICSDPISFSTYDWKSILVNQQCFGCNFWREKSIEEPNDRRVIANNCIYSIGKPAISKGRRDFLGHGGRHWTIRFNDGRVVETNNLWGGSEIPERFRHLFSNNATLGGPDMQPSPKSIALEVMGSSQAEIDAGICPTCKEPVIMSRFVDNKSQDEYSISGMCQNCQDSVFGTPKVPWGF